MIKLLGGQSKVEITPFELKNSGAVEWLVDYFTRNTSSKEGSRSLKVDLDSL